MKRFLFLITSGLIFFAPVYTMNEIRQSEQFLTDLCIYRSELDKALAITVKRHDHQHAKRLLQEGANPLYQDENGIDLLSYIVGDKYSSYSLDDIRDQHSKLNRTCNVLLKKIPNEQPLNLNSNAFDNVNLYQETLFHWAAFIHNIALVRILLRRNPKQVHEKDSNGKTPLLLAVISSVSFPKDLEPNNSQSKGLSALSLETIIELCKYGANPNEKYGNSTLLQYVVSKICDNEIGSYKSCQDTFIYLLAHGADETVVDENGHTPFFKLQYERPMFDTSTVHHIKQQTQQLKQKLQEKNKPKDDDKFSLAANNKELCQCIVM